MNRRRFLLSTAGGAIASRAVPDGSGVIDAGTGPQLFLDDLVIGSIQGLMRTVHRPKKCGLIQEADGRPWEMGDQISVVRDLQGRFHMTYRYMWWDPSVRDLHPSIGEDRAHWFRETTGYAISDDGLRWSKPVLGLVEGPMGFRPAPRAKWKDGVFVEPTGMSRQNNLGCPVQIAQDLNDFGGMSDAERRFLINVLHRNDTHPFADIVEAGLYFSPDVPDLLDPQWRRPMKVIWEGRRRGPRSWTTRVAGFDEREQVWFECAQSTFGGFQGRGGRDIARWTSPDLTTWSPEELVLPIADDESKDPRDFVEYMDIRAFRVADFYLGQLVIFHGDRSTPQAEMPTAKGIWRKGTTEMRLVMSRDAGRSWKPVGGKQAWIPCHEQENGYDRLVLTGSPVRVGEELWLYYSCWDGDHLAWNRDGTTYYKDRMRVGRTARATLRWNGFVSLHAGAAPGMLITKPLRLRGSRISLNAAAARGNVRVELQDSLGKVIPGFGLADSRPVTGNGVSQPVRWRTGDTLPAPGAPIRLRFAMRNADLFGFEIG